MPEDISQFFDNRQTQTFHPIHRREAEFWHPGNDAASLRIHISHIWEDIIMLRDMLLRSENNIEQRLLFKYILVELHSILSPIARLQTIIMTVPVAKQGKPTPFHSISVEDKETAKQLFKVHNIAKNKTESLLADIRNDIGAHRGLQPWERIIQLWESIEPEHFNDLISTIPPILNIAKKLDIYDWVRTTDGQIFEIYAGGHWEPSILTLKTILNCNSRTTENMRQLGSKIYLCPKSLKIA